MAKITQLRSAQWLMVCLFSVLGVVAFGIAPDMAVDTITAKTVEIPIAYSSTEFANNDGLELWREERIQRGDTLGSVLARLQVTDSRALAFLRTDNDARALYQLRPGRSVRVRTDDEGELLALRYLTNQDKVLEVSRDENQLRAQIIDVPFESRLAMRTGQIRTSLFAAADEVGMPDTITLQLAEIFSSDIDFYHDLRRGDRFVVVYEVAYLEGERIKTGRIVAAEFVNKGVSHSAIYFQDATGQGGYYTRDGKNLRKAFLRTPLEFSRITSGFSLARLHPILKTWRAHRGVDYAAPIGTPVRATADGKVDFIGAQGGYGNFMLLKHHGQFSTAYAHLSRFKVGIRKGSQVQQGEVIGYVGATGWATGPHLHYEFRIAGEQRDPLRVALPNAIPLGPQEKPRFEHRAKELMARVELTRGLTIAYAE